MSGSRRGVISELARAAEMTRKRYARHLVDTHGSQHKAAAAIGVHQSAIRNALHYKRKSGRNRIMMLAENAHMTTTAYVIMESDKDGGDTAKTAARLKTSASNLRRYLKHDTMRVNRRAPMPVTKRNRILALLKDGWRVCDVARMTETPQSTVRHWRDKIEHAKQAVRKLKRAERGYPLPLAGDGDEEAA